MHRYIDSYENSAEVSAAIARYRAGRSYREAQDRTPDSRRQPGGGSDVGSAGKRRAKAESALLCRLGELEHQAAKGSRENPITQADFPGEMTPGVYWILFSTEKEAAEALCEDAKAAEGTVI